MNWVFSATNKSHATKIPFFLLINLVAFIFSGCSGINQSVEKVKGLTTDLLPGIGEDIPEKRERLSKLITPLKEATFIFSPIIILQGKNIEDIKKNKFFLAGEIFSRNPEESISSLSSKNCFLPNENITISKLERLYHVFIKELGLKSISINKLNANTNIDTHYLIQPILLKYQYCDDADVEIRYMIKSGSGSHITQNIKTSHETENFKFPENDENRPFINYNHPEAQFPELRHALSMAFYKNTLDLIELISDEYNKEKPK